MNGGTDLNNDNKKKVLCQHTSGTKGVRAGSVGKKQRDKDHGGGQKKSRDDAKLHNF